MQNEPQTIEQRLAKAEKDIQRLYSQTFWLMLISLLLPSFVFWFLS